MNFLKRILKRIPIPLSKNHRYDLETRKIIKMVMSSNGTGVDVGCHEGEIMDEMLKAAPEGIHYGFEPIPSLYKKLKTKYKEKENCRIFNIALSDRKGESSFNYVTTNPAYSGLKKRSYDRPDEEDQLIQVETAKLDEIIPQEVTVAIMKIDVEGGEYQVLKGASEVIRRDSPYIIFEHGRGAAEYYDSGPEKVYSFFDSMGMQISTLTGFLKNDSPLSTSEFNEQFEKGINFYFIAHP